MTVEEWTQNLLPAIPMTLAWIVGLVIALVRIRKPGAGLLLVALLILLLERFVGLYLFIEVMREVYDRAWMQRGPDYARQTMMWFEGARDLVRAGAWVLVLVAVFRSGRAAVASPLPGEGVPLDRRRVGHVAPISKGLYLTMIIGGFVASLFITVAGLVMIGQGGIDAQETGLVIVGFSLVPMILAAIFLMVFIYKIWAAIQGGAARTTPGKAVGFLFIPLFNFYWIFQAYYGWTQDFNRYARETGANAPRMPEGMVLTLCILTFLTLIPFVGGIVSLVNMILMGVFIASACDGVNALARASRSAY